MVNLNRRELIEAAIGVAGSQLLPPIPVEPILIPYDSSKPEQVTVNVDYVKRSKADGDRDWYYEMKWMVNHDGWMFTFGRSSVYPIVIETTYFTVTIGDRLDFEPQDCCDHLITCGWQWF